MPVFSLVSATRCWVEFCFVLWLVAVLDERDRTSAGSLRVSPFSLNMSIISFPYIVITYVNEERDRASRFEIMRLRFSPQSTPGKEARPASQHSVVLVLSASTRRAIVGSKREE